MAELLIRAEDPWKMGDGICCKGDIVVVRPDGWPWGREECLPKFIVVKVPGTEEENKHLEEPLMSVAKIDALSGEMMRTTLKFRKSNISPASVDVVKIQVKDFSEITAVDLKSEIFHKSEEEPIEITDGYST